MAGLVHASSAILLDKRCSLGQHFKLSHSFSSSYSSSTSRNHRNASGVACRSRPVAIDAAAAISASWLSDSRIDGYGGWASPENYQFATTRGLLPHLSVGVQTALFLCLVAGICITCSSKVSKLHIRHFIAEIRLLKIPASAIPLEVPVISRLQEKLFDASSSIGKKRRMVKSNKNLKTDIEATKHEVSSMPDVWKVVVRPVVDTSQSEALLSLAKMKIVQCKQDPEELCTRREYARWLFLSNHVLMRNPRNNLFPSVFTEGETHLAFNDITPTDPDFLYIQGLAEAGVIPSKFISTDGHCNSSVEKQSCHFFNPERPISRMELVAWKICAEHRILPQTDRRTLAMKSGFIDVDQIHADALAPIFVDALAGCQSIALKAFGFSRRFQPSKPVTKGQAAVALISGSVAPAVLQELARIDAENSTKEAMIQDILAELVSKGEIKARWEMDISRMKDQRVEAERELEFSLSELQTARAENEGSLPFIVKENANLDCERKFLSLLKAEIQELKEKLSREETDIIFKKQQIEKCMKEAHEKRETVSNAKYRAEAVNSALRLYRLGLEDMAKQAQAQRELFAEAVNRWNGSSSPQIGPCIDVQEHNLNCLRNTDFNDAKLMLPLSGNMAFFGMLEQYLAVIPRRFEQGIHDFQNTLVNKIKSNGMREWSSAVLTSVSANISKIFQKRDPASSGTTA